MDCACTPICCTARRPAPFSTSGKTTSPRPATRGAKPSIVSPPRAASRCTSPRSANRWKPWIAPVRRWPPPGATELSKASTDSSGAALATAGRNAALNGISNIEFREADVFVLLAAYASARRQFQTVILDPPAFAKSRSTLEGAIRGYKEINLRALRMLDPGGILVTCSCSQRLSEAAFLELVAQASLDAGRRLRVLERRTQGLDHPILLTVPETHYLKCLIVEVV